MQYSGISRVPLVEQSYEWYHLYNIYYTSCKMYNESRGHGKEA